jgi:uncharacterized protein YegJ (DUF2314 family)
MSMVGANSLDNLDAAHFGQAKIDQRHIWVTGFKFPDSLYAIGCLADHFNVVHNIEQGYKTLAHDGMVFNN